jgi:hypothetical protein
VDPLPEGETGIAAKYPRDVGIARDPAVLFCDGFEDCARAEDLRRKWDAVYHDRCIRITEEPANVHNGKKALEFTVPQRKEELSSAAQKQLPERRDVLFLRYYSKFEKGFDQTGSSHNGGHISAGYYQNGRATPGVRADGRNNFLALFENWRGEAATPSPGQLNVYAYGDLYQETGHCLLTGARYYKRVGKLRAELLLERIEGENEYVGPPSAGGGAVVPVVPVPSPAPVPVPLPVMPVRVPMPIPVFP